MKIYTKTGDNGETALLGGKRIKKSDLRISAYGTCDELNSQIGVCINFIKSEEIKDELIIIQQKLFICGSQLATPENEMLKLKNVELISSKDVYQIETLIDRYQTKLEPLRNFILPGGSVGSSFLHTARTICRRCEREIVLLAQSEKIDNYLIIFFNRLSDYFFVISRYENSFCGKNDVLWNP